MIRKTKKPTAFTTKTVNELTEFLTKLDQCTSIEAFYAARADYFAIKGIDRVVPAIKEAVKPIELRFAQLWDELASEQDRNAKPVEEATNTEESSIVFNENSSHKSAIPSVIKNPRVARVQNIEIRLVRLEEKIELLHLRNELIAEAALARICESIRTELGKYTNKEIDGQQLRIFVHSIYSEQKDDVHIVNNPRYGVKRALASLVLAIDRLFAKLGAQEGRFAFFAMPKTDTSEKLDAVVGEVDRLDMSPDFAG